MSIFKITLIALSISLLGCHNQGDEPRPGKDLKSLVSSDQRFKATLRETNIDGSIGVSQPYELIIESLIPNQPAQEVMLVADRTSGLNIAWLSTGALEVCYEQEAHIRRFNNKFIVATEDNPTISEVEITLLRRPSLAGCASKG
jgi:uncharacterized lipoprotein NlpE involved in copper resistance